MKSFIRGIACTTALLVAGSVTNVGAAPQSAAAKPSDSAVDARISQRIKADPFLKAHEITVSVDEGVVTLRGTVQTETERAKAAQLANVDGVTRVENKIAVDAHATTKGTTGAIKEKTKEGAEKTKEGVDKAVDKSKEGADKAVDKTKEGSKTAYEKTKEGGTKAVDSTKKGANKVGEEATDGWITTKISSDFVNENLLHDSNINVDTTNHTVTLHGTVLSEAGRARAIAIAKGTNGVKTVVDKLTVGPRK
jgi:hyperosmotically inducible periplasmic protein